MASQTALNTRPRPLFAATDDVPYSSESGRRTDACLSSTNACFLCTCSRRRRIFARYEKQTAAPLERAPRAGSRNKREWQKLIDENNALILHHRQVVQRKRERAAAELLSEEVRRAKKGRNQK